MASTLLKELLLSSAGVGILKLKVCLGSVGKMPKDLSYIQERNGG